MDKPNSQELQRTLNEIKESVGIMHSFFEKNDLTPIFELADEIKNNQELFDEFVKDPTGIIERETGISLPEGGFHAHVVNNKNEYFPEEGSAERQIMFGEGKGPWGRVEVRLGMEHGFGCVLCLICQ
ncbi:hypothetical protein [Bacillus subtilis]|uniref:hypothetical protein n=1 Tax=Bacillus subtilis TaxID=1423 RepID=UPI003981BF72